MNRYTLGRLKNLREDFVQSAGWRKENNLKFDVSQWKTAKSVCAVGSAVGIPNSKTRKAGLKIKRASSCQCNECTTNPQFQVWYKDNASWGALCKFFDLSEDELVSLFLPRGEKIKPSDVLKKLDRLISKLEKGKIS